MQLVQTDPAYNHMKPFVPIIQDKELYPVIVDSQGIICSLPPIINGLFLILRT